MNNLHVLTTHLAVILALSNLRKSSMDNEYTCAFSKIRKGQANSNSDAKTCNLFMRGS